MAKELQYLKAKEPVPPGVAFRFDPTPLVFGPSGLKRIAINPVFWAVTRYIVVNDNEAGRVPLPRCNTVVVFRDEGGTYVQLVGNIDALYAGAGKKFPKLRDAFKVGEAGATRFMASLQRG